MILPKTEYLKSVEKLFCVCYPVSFYEFCEKNTDNSFENYHDLSEGQFINNIETLIKVNELIGYEQWADYEKAIAGKIHPKDGKRLWGELLPVYFNNGIIYGYKYNEPYNQSVYVWSTHSIVYEYKDINDWINGICCLK